MDAIDSRGMQARDHVPRSRENQIKRDERPGITSVERHVSKRDCEVPLCAQFPDYSLRGKRVKDHPTGRLAAQEIGQLRGAAERLDAHIRKRERGPCPGARIDEHGGVDP
jgi:hypothetical protein